MRLFNRFFTIIFIIALNQLHANNVTYYSEKEAIELYSKIITAFDNDLDKRVWDGYIISPNPTLIHFSNNHIYAFNLRTEDPRWNAINILNENIFFSGTDHWGITQIPVHPFFSIDNQFAYVFKGDLTGNITYSTFIVFVHERFHKYQMTNWQDFAPTSTKYTAHCNEENIVLSFIENLILQDFIRNNSVEKLKDFLAVNLTRRNIIGEESYNWELWQQKTEGTAEYIHAKTFMELQILADFNFVNFMEKRIESSFTQSIDAIIKWRHYLVGGILCHAFDFLNIPSWKEVLSVGKKQIALLEETLNLSQEEITERLEILKFAYNYDALKNKANLAIDSYKNELNSIYQQYNSLKGIPIIIEEPNGGSGGGATGKTYYLADGGTLNINATHTTTCQNGQWVLNLINVPFIINTYTSTEFKESHDLHITIDNIFYDLQNLVNEEGKIIHFSSVKWEGVFSTLNATQSEGILTVKNGKVYLNFNIDSKGSTSD